MEFEGGKMEDAPPLPEAAAPTPAATVPPPAATAPSTTTAPRQDLVDTAVRFLANPRVASTSEELKRAFLSKKGLTQEEIGLAIARFAASRPGLPAQPSLADYPRPGQPGQADFSRPGTSVAAYPPAQLTYGAVQPSSSFGTRLRDFLNLLLLIGGASYGLRYLWKRYIQPWLFGEKRAKSTNEILLQTSQNLLTAMQSLQKTVKKLQDTLEVKIKAQEGPEARALEAIRQELTTVKGLMLSSRSFPTNPVVSLPAWQLEDPADRKLAGDPVGSGEMAAPTAAVSYGSASASSGSASASSGSASASSGSASASSGSAGSPPNTSISSCEVISHNNDSDEMEILNQDSNSSNSSSSGGEEAAAAGLT